jgi:hypothetical protein
MAKTLKKSRVNRVWHILNFEQRFEMPDDMRKCRKGALLFLKYIVSPSDDESINLSEQLASLRCMATEAMPEVMLEGCFWRLAKVAANRSRAFRGYMLDERYSPAPTSRIAMWLGLESSAATSVLATLEKAGLIERVEMPEFKPDTDDADLPLDEPPCGGKKKQKQDGKKREPRGSKGGKKGVSARGRKFPPPFKKGEDESETRPSASAEEKDKTRPSASAEGKGPAAASPALAAEGKGKTESTANGQAQADKPNAEGKAQGNLGPELQAILARLSPTSHSPTATPPNADVPILPGETDARAAGASSVNERDREAEARLLRLAEQQRKFANPERFADEIFRAIQEPQLKDSPHGAREFGVLYAFWQEVMQRRLPLDVMERLWNGCLKSAQRIGKNRRKCKSPGAVWRHEASQRLANPFGSDKGSYRKTAVK